MKRSGPFTSVLVLFAAVLGTGAVPAAVIVVNSAADPGTGVCDAAECTLREAIVLSNASTAADEIHFNILGSGPHEILVSSPLPRVDGPLTIDGYTQPGSSPNTLTAEQGPNNAVLRIGLVGSNCTSCVGLRFNSPPVLVRGLAIGGFDLGALQFDGALGLGSNAVRLEGSFLGLRTDGLTAVTPAPMFGVFTNVATQIGGVLPAQRNVIAAQAVAGIRAIRSGDLVVEGNIVGMAADGQSYVGGSTSAAIIFEQANLDVTPLASRVGGAGPGQRNWLAGGSEVVKILCRTAGCYDGTLVQGNRIQLKVDGTPLPQMFPGAVQVQDLPVNSTIRIGGIGPGEGNVIATPGARGFFVQLTTVPVPPTGNVEMAGNRFLVIPPPNLAIPIRLQAPDQGQNLEPLPNDPGDADEGPNRRQNWPEIDLVSWDEQTTTIRYRVDSTISRADYPLRLEFAQFSNIGMTGQFAYDIYPGGSAQQLHTVVLPRAAGTILPFRATVTSALGATSEFTPDLYGDPIFSNGFETP